MKKISDAIMVSIVPGCEFWRNVESVAMLGGIPLALRVGASSDIVAWSLPDVNGRSFDFLMKRKNCSFHCSCWAVGATHSCQESNLAR